MKKKLLKVIVALIIVPILIFLICHHTITSSAYGKTYDEITVIPTNKVGLVLGTSKKLSSGDLNPYYEYRILATVQLFKANKIQFVLVSGDNGSRYYNEPTTFKKDLVKAGIPADKIFLDYAGFRTLDSMVRAKVVFGLDKVTVISQKFHNERAIYLAERKGLKAIGYNAKDVSGQNGLKVHVREYFARVKAFLDMLINTQPKFFGDKIEIK
ncbi:YdcF family protein [Aurantibacter crassamenti]|uniref:SanA/YdcF family protein n=1 Tax=Aurantibacter crassamenti TaxID=1837375 RepID=UPI0019399971|nr:ElyC/SanA/YdcF family protein [Aurantibacter crassamenti]MBM1106026.1 YdcF family protein [Aurantibacter crassamenti]